MRLDYAPAISFIEGFMNDTVEIRRDAEWTTDDTLNEATGKIVPPSPDHVVIYNGPGRIAFIRPATDRQEELGEQPIVQRTYKLLLPAATADIEYNDVCEVVECQMDPWLSGRVMRIINIMGRTHSFYRRVTLQDTSDPTRDYSVG